MRDLYAKKYTILINDEPLHLHLKNGRVEKAKFMNKKVVFELDRNTIDKIRSYPSKVVNGANFEKNEAFTKPLSKMLSQQLDLAMVKKDKKTMSRFAQSDLIPDEQREGFIEALNSHIGIRGMIKDILNDANQLVQRLANKVDKYFDRLNDKVVNKKLDEHLEKFQQKELNRLDINAAKNFNGVKIDGKLMQKAEDFIQKNKTLWNEIKNHETFDEAYPPHREALQSFLKESVENGYTAQEAGQAFFKASAAFEKEKLAKSYFDMEKSKQNVEKELESYKFKEASKNESLNDFLQLQKNVTKTEALDLLIENKEYQTLDNDKQMEFENNHLFNDKQFVQTSESVLKNRSTEIKAIATEIKTPEPQYFSFTKEAVENDWKIAQAENRTSEISTEKFMSLSAVKFGGVSKERLNNWRTQMEEMRAKGKNVPSEKKVQQFIDGTLNNAKRLEEKGFLKENKQGEYSFAGTEKREKLYKDIKAKEHQYDLKERVQDLSSEKSFEKLIQKDGTIDIERLNAYANKLHEIAKLAQKQQESKKVDLTRADLRSDTIKLQNTKTQNQRRERG